MRKRPSAPAAAGEEQNIADGQPHRGILSTIFIELGWAVAEFALLVVGTGLLDLYVDTRNIYCVIIGTILVGGAVISGIAFVNWTSTSSSCCSIASTHIPGSASRARVSGTLCSPSREDTAT